MCHGTNYWEAQLGRAPLLDAQHFEGHMKIAAELGFQSISYEQLADWRLGKGGLPDRPIMLDFDHPNRSILRRLWPVMERSGFTGNLFVNTSPMEKDRDDLYMRWEDIRTLLTSDWHIGSHTHNHYDLSYLAGKDPSGALIREQMERCDDLLEEHLGIVPKDFAFTGTSWSRVAEDEARKRYRFGRLWIVGAHYDTDEGRIRYADLAGSSRADERDGGPPHETRYITKDTDPYRLPSMELTALIYEHDAFRKYLEGALAGEAT